MDRGNPPWSMSYSDHSFHSHYNSVQNLQTFLRSQPMQEYSPRATNERIGAPSSTNEITAAAYNSILSHNTASQPYLHHRQIYTATPPDNSRVMINESSGATPPFRCAISFAEILQPTRKTINGNQQFHTILSPTQMKYLRRRAVRWGVIINEGEPLSQETIQKIFDKLAQPEQAKGGIRLQRKVVAAATSSETKKTPENPTSDHDFFDVAAAAPW